MKAPGFILLAPLFLFLCGFDLPPPPKSLPIHDNATFIDISSRSDDYTSYSEELKITSKPKVRSKLKSIAEVIECNKRWASEVSKGYPNAFPADFEEGWLRVDSISELAPLACAKLTVGKENFVIQYFRVIKPKPTSERRLLTIHSLNVATANLGSFIYAGGSNGSDGDGTRDLHVAAIADVNNDNVHEIVLYDGSMRV